METVRPIKPSDSIEQDESLEILRQACRAAEADLSAAEQRLRRANAKVRRLALRVHATAFGIPPCVAGLIAGSVALLIPSVGLILTGRAHPLALLIFCAVGYALIGIGVFAIVR